MTLSFFITVIPDHDKPQPPGCLLGYAGGHFVHGLLIMQGQISKGAVLDNSQARQWILEGFGAQS
ncbi:hypothetical protein [Escherichia coli]|uniref:hypothetical protein n=2 Tax=Escherichia coli TaxID=562 RepID=UPI0007A60B0A|nr:hypothetical protein [Escherichia coli]